MYIHVNMNKNIILTVLLIILISASSVFSMNKINDIAKQNCFNTLYQETERMARDIEQQIENDTDQLEVIAAIIAQHDIKSEHVMEILTLYKSRSMIDRLEILLPDNSLILSDGSVISAEGIMSFERESVLGSHISDKETDIMNPENSVLRLFVPVKYEEQTIAVLCGVINLDTLPDYLNAAIYDGKASVYVIDGSSGDFLVDTWHKSLGNTAQLSSRKTKDGTPSDERFHRLLEGNSGYVVFQSETTGDYLYFYCTPTNINKWNTAISVPEKTVLGTANNIKKILYTFALFEMLCLAAYFVITLINVRKDSYEKQKRLDMLSYIYDIKKILFTAHRRRENIDLALMRIAAMTHRRLRSL